MKITIINLVALLVINLTAQNIQITKLATLNKNLGRITMDAEEELFAYNGSVTGPISDHAISKYDTNGTLIKEYHPGVFSRIKCNTNGNSGVAFSAFKYYFIPDLENYLEGRDSSIIQVDSLIGKGTIFLSMGGLDFVSGKDDNIYTTYNIQESKKIIVRKVNSSNSVIKQAVLSPFFKFEVVSYLDYDKFQDRFIAKIGDNIAILDTNLNVIDSANVLNKYFHALVIGPNGHLYHTSQDTLYERGPKFELLNTYYFKNLNFYNDLEISANGTLYVVGKELDTDETALFKITFNQVVTNLKDEEQKEVTIVPISNGYRVLSPAFEQVELWDLQGHKETHFQREFNSLLKGILMARIYGIDGSVKTVKLTNH